jgi:hypothetical protein
MLLGLRNLLLSAIFFIPSFINSQVVYNNFRDAEDSISHLFKSISNCKSDSDKLSTNKKIVLIFEKLLSQPESFDFSFDSLKSTGRLYAPDKSFRIINWNIPLNNGTHRYFSFFQIPGTKQDMLKLVEMSDHSNDITNPENIILNPKNWFGCLYYKIIKSKVKGQPYYTLLALQYHDYYITRKIIDVLQFDTSGNMTFGAPVFQVNNVLKNRVVFEYSAKVSMNLKYDENLKMIIFDHLTPSELKYLGQYEYYAPDMTFDGFKFEKDRWVFKENLDIRRPHDPRR